MQEWRWQWIQMVLASRSINGWLQVTLGSRKNSQAHHEENSGSCRLPWRRRAAVVVQHVALNFFFKKRISITPREKFIIDPKSKYWILKSLSKKWNYRKARLKTECYLTRATNKNAQFEDHGITELKVSDILLDQCSKSATFGELEKWQVCSSTISE